MVPRNKPHRTNPKQDDDDRQDIEVQDITVGNKNLNVKLSLSGRGIILVYALAFAIVFGVVAWFSIQLIVALKTPGSSTIPSVTGFILWTSLTFISALLSR